MDRELLAAYVSGDLAPDEADAVEASLARDPQLRAEVARLRRLDRALGELPEVAPREGFDARLRAAVADELDRLPFDELATRRASRTIPPGLRRLGLATAAAAALGIVGVGLAQLVGGAGGEDEAGMTAFDAAGDEARETEMGVAEAIAPPSGPLVVAEGRSVTQEDLDTVADDLGLFGRLAGPLSETDDPATVAALFRDLLLGQGDAADTAAAPEAQAEEDADDGAGTDTAAGAGAGISAQLEVRGATPEQLQAVQRCLPAVLEAEQPVIPLYAELLTFEGVPAILYVVASEDPGTGGYERAEVWVLERDSCQVRFFSQA